MSHTITRATKADRARRAIADHLCVAIDEVKPESHIANDLQADSLDRVELVMVLEDEFGIEIPDEDWESHWTVQQFIDLVERHTP